MINRTSLKLIGEKTRGIVRNYNEILVVASIVVSVVVQFIPDSFTWKDSLLIVCVYTGVISLVFILLDIKDKIEYKSALISFPNLFIAKDEIFRQIEEKRKRKPQNEVLEVKIIGLKLRAISGVVHEFLNSIIENNKRISNIKITIYYLDPDSYETLFSPLIPPENMTEFIAQNNEYKAVTNANIRELLRYNNNQVLSSKNIKVDAYTYKSFPSFWGFGIDEKVAFVGSFTWNNQLCTFIGPQNPCIMGEKNDEMSRVILNYHYNRCEIFSILSSIGKSGDKPEFVKV